MSGFEKNLQAQIMRYCVQRGAVVFNIMGNEQQSGVPDLLVCYMGRFIGLEVKGADGQLSKLQKVRLTRIQNAGGIGEEVRSMAKVQEIFNTVAAKQSWINGDYTPKGGKA